MEISRPLTTGAPLGPQEVLALPSDSYQGSTFFTNEFKQSLEKYGNGDTLKVIPVYNYYLKSYESFYKDIPVTNSNLPHEKAIPNFYYLLSIISDKETYASATPYTAPIALNIYSSNFRPYQLDSILKSLSATRFKSETNDLLVSPIGPFLPADIISKELDPATERNSVVVVTPSFYKEFSALAQEQKKLHPYYNEIKIPVQKGGTVFRDLFKKTKFYDQLQYRAAIQIKLVDKYLSLGGDPANILSKYEVYYNKVVSAGYLQGIDAAGKVVFANSAHPNKAGTDGGIMGGQKVPYQTFNKIYSFDLAEFDVTITNTNLSSQNLDYKDMTDPRWIPFKNVSAVGSVAVADYEDASFIKISAPAITEESLIELQSAAPGTDAGVQTIPNPLVFYSDSSSSENDYIAGVIQSKANQILNAITSGAKLNLLSVLNNKKNYSEILFFEVEKCDEDGNKIQTFILPNDPDVSDVIEYIDSQIQYGKGYVYKFYAHTISVGNYLRRNKSFNIQPAGDIIPPELNPEGEDGPIASEVENYEGVQVDFEYENELDIKLIRAPYQNTKELLLEGQNPTVTYNIDSPPVPPNVEFFPFKNVNDKIGFWFNVGIGSIKMKPIDLASNVGEATSAVTNINRIRTNQLINGEITQEDFNSVNILYKTDDFGGKIQVYRVTSRPTAYSDFKDNKIADIDVVGPRSFVDDIIPNQDYYYVFRHVDVHGLPSNPSPVYHLKMVTDTSAAEAGSVRVGVDGSGPILFNELIYLNNENKVKVEEKTFKKYLLVERTLNQSYLNFGNFETSGLDSINTALDIKTNQSDLRVGSTDSDFETVNGKKFKIRVTSKQTGRKIDLNVDFKNLTVIENYEE